MSFFFFLFFLFFWHNFGVALFSSFFQKHVFQSFSFLCSSQHHTSSQVYTIRRNTHTKKRQKKNLSSIFRVLQKVDLFESFSDSLFLPAVSFFPLDVPRHSKEEGENNISNLGIQIVRESALNNNNNISKRLARGRLLTNTLEKHVPCFRSHTRYVSFRSRFGRVRSQRARS